MAYWDTSLGNNYVLRLTVSQISQDYTNNRSQVQWWLNIVQLGSFEVSSGYQNTWSVNVDGNIFSGSKQYNFFTTNNVELGSGVVTVNHNSDGSKVIGANASYNDIANTYLTDGSIPTSFLALSTIPRGSKPRLTNPTTGAIQSHTYAGAVVRINTDRASTSFTHTVRYTLGNASGTIATGVANSVDWTIPMSILTQFPKAATGYGYIFLDTYNGSSLVASGVGVQFAVMTPATAVPSIDGITIVEATPGIAATIGGYVQGVSKLTVTTVGEAGIYGSTIVERKVEVAGQTVKGDPVTTAPISASGTVPVKVTVTDSRGKTKSLTQNIAVIARAAPRIVSMSVQRALSSGTPDESGTYLRVNINATVASLIVNSVQKNTLRYVVYVRVYGTTSWGTAKADTTLAVGTTSFNSYVNLSPYLSGTSYDVRVVLYDEFSSTAAERQVASAVIAVHFDGNVGMGVGKYRQDGMLDVAGQIYANNRRPVQFAIATGRVTGLTTAVAVGDKITGSVSFPTNPGGGARFSQAPIVNITGENGRFTWARQAVTTSGFTYTADNWSDATGVPTAMDWIAIQMLPSAAAG